MTTKTQATSPMRRRRTGIVTLLTGTMLAGCGSRIVVSEPQSLPADSRNGEPGGLVYSLPQTIITVDGARDDKGQVTYTITPTIMPDAAARYRLRFTSTGFTDDDLNLGVDANGLLTSGTATITDQTPAIIVALAKTAATIVQPSPFAAMTAPATKPAASPYPFHMVYTLDAFLRNPRLPDQRHVAIEGAGLELSRPAPNCAFSVCYRTPVLLRGRIVDTRGQDVGAHFAFLAIDPSSTEGIDIRGAALVKRTDTVTFTNGIAVGNAIKQDSMVLAAANLPLDVIKAILSAPAELLTLKVNNVTDQANLVQQQANLLTQQAALITAQKTLQQTQSGAAVGGAVTGTGTSP
jgi:hypothetical protein